MCLAAAGVALILFAVMLAKNGIDEYFFSTRPSGIPISIGFFLVSGGVTVKGQVDFPPWVFLLLLYLFLENQKCQRFYSLRPYPLQLQEVLNLH